MTSFVKKLPRLAIQASNSSRLSSRRRAAQQERRQRTSARQFLRDVRAELRKVDWPTRRELVTYTVVVLVTVTVMTTLVFGLDFVIQRAIFNVIGG